MAGMVASVLLFLVLYWLADVRRVTGWAAILKPARGGPAKPCAILGYGLLYIIKISCLSRTTRSLATNGAGPMALDKISYPFSVRG